MKSRVDSRLVRSRQLRIAAAVFALSLAGFAPGHAQEAKNGSGSHNPRWAARYATGDGATLAKGVAAALSHMNSAQKSKSEDGG